MILTIHGYFFPFSPQELNKEAGAFRGGAITPDGLIDEDFEKELGTPTVSFRITFTNFVPCYFCLFDNLKNCVTIFRI